MGYFPNGTSGLIFQEENCSSCANAEEDGYCAIWDAHVFYNYDQFKNEELKAVLDLLIRPKGNDSAAECALYRKEV